MKNYLENTTYQKDVKRAWSILGGSKGFERKTVLVTGATGLIGSFLVDMFLYANLSWNAKINVLAVSRKRSNLIQRFGENPDSGLCYIEQDISQPFEVKETIDYIIHAAGNAYPAAFREKPVETLLSNVTGTRNLLELARKNQNCPFLFVSSGEVYGGNTCLEYPLMENDYGYVDVLSPRSCYPMGKRAGENLCVSWMQEYGTPVKIVRPCHTFGPNVTESDNRATVQFMKNVIRQEDIVLKSEGKQIRSYCYVADCASALLFVLLNGEHAKAYNLATDETISIRGFADECANIAGKQVILQLPNQTEKEERTPIKNQILSDKALRELGWKKKFSIKEGMEHSIEIMRAFSKTL